MRLERSHKRSSDPLGRAARSRGTSHPLPLLNAGGALDEKIMSQANSMNKDARQEALRVLEVQGGWLGTRTNVWVDGMEGLKVEFAIPLGNGNLAMSGSSTRRFFLQ